MRWLVIGASGLLGRDVCATLLGRLPNDEIVAPRRSALDLSDLTSVRECVSCVRPDIVLNCAARTDVDGIESDPDGSLIANGLAPIAIAEALSNLDKGMLIQVSTDYVFDGRSQEVFGEDAETRPISFYGLSKLVGEYSRAVIPERAIVVRTAWLYGRGRSNFVTRVEDQLKSHGAVTAVNDQAGHPTWSSDCAGRLITLALALSRGEIDPGVHYHAVNTGVATWYEVAQEVANLRGFDPSVVEGVSGERLNRAAQRPQRIELSDRRSLDQGIPGMRTWREALKAFLST